MGGVLIPDDVRAFLLRHIDSIAQLEALLLAHGAPSCAWNAERMARRLYITTQEASAMLDQWQTWCEIRT